MARNLEPALARLRLAGGEPDAAPRVWKSPAHARLEGGGLWLARFCAHVLRTPRPPPLAGAAGRAVVPCERSHLPV